MSPAASPNSRPGLPWHHRLEARVLLAVTLVAGIALLAMLLAARHVVTSYALARSADDLVAAREAFNGLVQNRAESAEEETRLVTELPTFRALLQNKEAFADPATMSQMAKDSCGKIGADFCVVTDEAGAWVGQVGTPTSDLKSLIATSVSVATHGHAARDIVTSARGLFLVVSEPAAFGDSEVLGSFTAGYQLDDGEAAGLARSAHCDVTFICRGQICGSSLPAGRRAALAGVIQRETTPFGSLDGAPILRTVGDASFVGGEFALVVPAGMTNGLQVPASVSNARLVLMQDWAPTERAEREVDADLFGVGFVTFALALAGGLVFSRRMTRPLRNLADVADEIAGGNWSERLPAAGPAEAQTMAIAFNRMTVTLTHWHSEAQSQAARVQESYERFRAVTDSANDAIVSVNRQGEIIFWNLRAKAVFGYDETEALGQPLTLLMPERYRLEYADEMARLIMGESCWIGSTVELLGLCRDGSEVPVELSLSTWKSGDESFYTAVIRDITERKQAAHALQQREDQLRQAQKMEAVGRLAGGIAHDFNNLLTAILGYSDLLLEDLPADQPLRKDVQEIQKAGHSAAALIRELLAFSRKQVLQPVVLDMNAVAADTENLLRRLIGEHITLSLALDPNLGYVRADRVQMEQILINLAVNARDAMPDGGRLTIRTANGLVSAPVQTSDISSSGPFDDADAESRPAPVGGRHVILTVSDSGHGMSAETRARIFEPFFTTKPIGKGTGLGLATVYGIVKQSGGQIWVESEPDCGASFHIALPLLEHAVLTDPSSAAAVPVARGMELLLLVEDNDSVRSLARQALQRSGYNVIEASNGEEALRLAKPQMDQIALLVTDVVMPVMGGRELARQLTEWRPDLKIIFTSGYIDDEVTRQTTPQMGATFLQKPFTPAALTRAVRNVLDAPKYV